MDENKEYVLHYELDLDDIKQIIQEETKFVEEGWIPDSKEHRRNAIEWGLKVQQLEILQYISSTLNDIRQEMIDQR